MPALWIATYRSFEKTGEELFIEVKTTNGPIVAPLYASENERLCSDKHAVKYGSTEFSSSIRLRSYTD
jgi:hypothetical protein